jgi:hypothetical protein
MSEEEKSKGGRPVKYDKKFCNTVRRGCLLGATDEELAEMLNIAVSTFYEWKNKYKEFSEAINEGKEKADSQVADALFKRAIGYSHMDTKFATHEGMITDQKEFRKHYAPDPTACIFWLKNRQRGKWKDKQEHEHTGDLNVNILKEDSDL